MPEQPLKPYRVADDVWEGIRPAAHEAVREERRPILITARALAAVVVIVLFGAWSGLFWPDVVLGGGMGSSYSSDTHSGDVDMQIRNMGISAIAIDGPATVDLPGVAVEIAAGRPIPGRRVVDWISRNDIDHSGFRGVGGEIKVLFTVTSCQALNSHIESLSDEARRKVVLRAHLTVPVHTWRGLVNVPLRDPDLMWSDSLGRTFAGACGIDPENLPQKAPAQLPPDQVAGEFVSIPPGKFMMGHTTSPVEIRENLAFSPMAMREREVTITRKFEMAKYEVTQAQWYTVMGTIPSFFAGDNSPVDSVNWEDIQRFLEKLNAGNDGYRYRLPTEAEWEYAARAGSTAAPDLDAVAWHHGNSSARTHPVGTKQPNAWGLYDMIGNVSEWVQDWWDWLPETPGMDPQGPDKPEIDVKIQRGGSFNDDLPLVSVSYRMRRVAPFGTKVVTGFRCVRERIP
ncbi:MAG TPA: formylglycine-generating enzyme family protein [Terriglobia bacterium]|nr:formylglycine-generating enzyme family protein [Terriglobia bacterium]